MQSWYSQLTLSELTSLCVFVIISETGESDIFYDKRILDLLDVDQELDYIKDLSSIVSSYQRTLLKRYFCLSFSCSQGLLLLRCWWINLLLLCLIRLLNNCTWTYFEQWRLRFKFKSFFILEACIILHQVLELLLLLHLLFMGHILLERKFLEQFGDNVSLIIDESSGCQ